MTQLPAVSVLMPVRNGAEWLDEAARSISGQTLGDFEVVVVDDGSTDDTPAVLAAWAADDPRVRVVRQGAAGIVAALERARATARGRYLARMDADDVSDPRRLALQFALMESDRSLAGCGCGVRYFPEEAVKDGARRYERWINAAVTPEAVERAMFVECPLAHPTFFLDAAAVDRVGGYQDHGWPEDYDLVLRMWAEGGRFAKVPEILLHWRERPDRLSRSDPRYAPEAFARCKVHHLRRTLLVGRDAVVIWGAGPVGKAFSRELSRQRVTVRAFAEVDPRKIGQEIHGAPVLDTAAALREASALHLAAVGQEGVREHLRGLLSGAGFRESQDFVAVA